MGVGSGKYLSEVYLIQTDETNNGIRLLSYAAHAESLRGDNCLLSRDFPGAVADNVMALCNDELGYILPPSAILLNEEMPYLERVVDETGENHYEETNSVGTKTAEILAEAFEKALRKQQR